MCTTPTARACAGWECAPPSSAAAAGPAGCELTPPFSSSPANAHSLLGFLCAVWEWVGGWSLSSRFLSIRGHAPCRRPRPSRRTWWWRTSGCGSTNPRVCAPTHPTHPDYPVATHAPTHPTHPHYPPTPTHPPPPTGLVGAVKNFTRFWRRARDVEARDRGNMSAEGRIVLLRFVCRKAPFVRLVLLRICGCCVFGGAPPSTYPPTHPAPPQGASLPLLLWRESGAQHFEGPRGGNFDPQRQSWRALRSAAAAAVPLFFFCQKTDARRLARCAALCIALRLAVWSSCAPFLRLPAL